MQITHNYNYAAFAIYLALEKHPGLATYGVKYLTPKSFYYDELNEKPERLIKNMYEKLVSVVKANKIDISEFASIFERGHYTVSEKYKWESAGWFWKNRVCQGDGGLTTTATTPATSLTLSTTATARKSSLHMTQTAGLSQ